MARFAPVAPIQILEGLAQHSREAFGDYHLLLAHHTVEHERRFFNLFKRVNELLVAVDAEPITVIMDNSIVELGGAVDDDMIRKAVKAVRGEKVRVLPVLPDVMGNGFQTRQMSHDAYIRWFETDMPNDGYCVVCQGEDFQDYQESLVMFGNQAAYPLIRMLTIPRILTKLEGSRVRAAIRMRDYQETHEIHLLGFSDSITDDIDSAAILPTSGIDSAVPIRIADVFTEFVDPGKRPPTWFETAQITPLMLDNLDIAKRMFQTGN
jgi:hypothetical protein